MAVIIFPDFCRSKLTIPLSPYHLFTCSGDSEENPLHLENPVEIAADSQAATRPPKAASSVQRAALMEKARALEASFLAEMLSHAGLDAKDGTFSGGVGEAQFASFLRDEQAKAVVQHGGIGLAEHLFQSLLSRDHG